MEKSEVVESVLQFIDTEIKKAQNEGHPIDGYKRIRDLIDSLGKAIEELQGTLKSYLSGDTPLLMVPGKRDEMLPANILSAYIRYFAETGNADAAHFVEAGYNAVIEEMAQKNETPEEGE